MSIGKAAMIMIIGLCERKENYWRPFNLPESIPAYLDVGIVGLHVIGGIVVIHIDSTLKVVDVATDVFCGIQMLVIHIHINLPRVYVVLHMQVVKCLAYVPEDSTTVGIQFISVDS